MTADVHTTVWIVSGPYCGIAVLSTALGFSLSTAAIVYLPLSKELFIGLPIGVHGFGWKTKSTDDFDGKALEIKVSSDDCADAHEKYGIQWRHDNNGANTIGPGTVTETSVNVENILDGWTNLRIANTPSPV